MRTVTVNVTQEDIDRGVRGRSQRCALALAISRAVGEAVSVGLASASWGSYSVRLPPVAVQLGADFDFDRPISPIAFPLRIPNATEVSHA